MNLSRCWPVAVPAGLLCLALTLLSAASPASNGISQVSPIDFKPEGAATPEIAATNLFQACTAKSPKHFAQHVLLGVCDGPIDTINKYAESLHTTTYTNGKDNYTVYDLPKLMKKETERVIASRPFADDAEASLQIQFVTTYYARKFSCVEVAADNYDGSEYRTRIVVAMLDDHWYAIPRCRSSKRFYQVADAMRFAAPKAETGK